MSRDTHYITNACCMQSTKKKTRQGFFFVKLTNSMLLASGPNFFPKSMLHQKNFTNG